MAIVGQWVSTFENANLACVDGISLNADYPHVFFDVVSVDKKNVTLKSHSDGTEMTLKRKRGHTSDFLEIEMKSSYEKIFRLRPAKFKITPFKGKKL